MDSYLKSFLPFAQKRMGFNKPPSIFFDSDEQNSKKVLGKTAHYNPESMEVVVYVDGRHPKDVIRSLSHELVHHTQNCRGDLNSDIAGETELGYAQNNPHMRNMESEAYEQGNLCMRDWEDSVKVHLQETNYYHTNGDGKQMDNYKHIVETTAKRVAAKIREARLQDKQVEESEEIEEVVDELDERKKRDNPRNDRGMPSRLKMNEDEELDEEEEIVEGAVEEVEETEAGAEINESNDQWYQRNLFEDLIKKWAK